MPIVAMSTASAKKTSVERWRCFGKAPSKSMLGDEDREQHRAHDHAHAETPPALRLGAGCSELFRRHRP